MAQATRAQIDKADIILQAVEAVKFIASWNKKGAEEYTPLSGFVYSKNDINKPDRLRFKRPANGHTVSAKRKAYDRLSNHIKRRLTQSDGRRAADSIKKLKITTLHKYYGEIRSAIQRETNQVSLTLVDDINKLGEDFPLYKKKMDVLKKTSALLLDETKRAVMNDIHSDNTALSEKTYDALFSINLDNEVVASMGLNDAKKKTRTDNQDSNLAERKTSAITLPYASIERITNDCLQSESFYKLALGIALATGRRAIEVIYRGNFKATKNKREIKFTGQAKTSKLSKEKPNFLPLTMNAEIIINAVEKLRSTDQYLDLYDAIKDLPEYEQNIVINRRTASYLNDLIRKEFDNDNLVFHSSRVIAVKVAMEKLHKPAFEHLDNGAFIATYTGHTLNGKLSFTDGASYEYIHIDTESKDTIESRVDSGDITRKPETMGGLLKALEADKLSTSKPFLKWYASVMENISIYPFQLNQSLVSKGYDHNGQLLRIGGGRVAVRNYFNHPIIKDFIERYNNGE